MTPREGVGQQAPADEVLQANEAASMIGQQKRGHVFAHPWRPDSRAALLQTCDQPVDGFGHGSVQLAQRLRIVVEPLGQWRVEHAGVLERLYRGLCRHRSS